MADFHTGRSSKRLYFIHIHRQSEDDVTAAWAYEISNLKFLMNKCTKPPLLKSQI
jgi:hypothetical protein